MHWVPLSPRTAQGCKARCHQQCCLPNTAAPSRGVHIPLTGPRPHTAETGMQLACSDLAATAWQCCQPEQQIGEAAPARRAPAPTATHSPAGQHSWDPGVPKQVPPSQHTSFVVEPGLQTAVERGTQAGGKGSAPLTAWVEPHPHKTPPTYTPSPRLHATHWASHPRALAALHACGRVQHHRATLHTLPCQLTGAAVVAVGVADLAALLGPCGGAAAHLA